MAQLLKSQVLNGASWFFLEKLTRLGGAFLIGAMVARYLGPAQYGALVYSLALVATLGFLGSLGLESLVVRDLVCEPQKQQQILTTYFWARLIGGALTLPLAVAYVFSVHPGESELLWFVFIGSLGPILAAWDVTDCLAQAQHQFRLLSLFRMSGFVVSSAAKCWLVWVKASVIWFVVVTVVEVGVVAALFVWRLRELELLPSLSWSREEMCRLLSDGKLMILSGLCVVIYSKLDVLIMGGLLSTKELGPYAIAASMCAAWNMVGTSLVQAWAPHVSAAKMAGQAAYIKELRRLLGAMMIVSILGSLGLSALSHWIFDWLLGAAYAQGASFFTVLIWSSVPVFLGLATGQIIVNDRLYRICLVRSVMAAAVTFALTFPLAAIWGGVGVALGVVGGALSSTLSIFLSPSARTALWVVLKGGSLPSQS